MAQYLSCLDLPRIFKWITVKKCLSQYNFLRWGEPVWRFLSLKYIYEWGMVWLQASGEWGPTFLAGPLQMSTAPSPRATPIPFPYLICCLISSSCPVLPAWSGVLLSAPYPICHCAAFPLLSLPPATCRGCPYHFWHPCHRCHIPALGNGCEVATGPCSIQ